MSGGLYPEDAACAGHPEPWIFDGPTALGRAETRAERHDRHAQALAVCATCPVTAECAAAVDYAAGDEGVRGGRVLPENHRIGGYGEIDGVSRRSWKRKSA